MSATSRAREAAEAGPVPGTVSTLGASPLHGHFDGSDGFWFSPGVCRSLTADFGSPQQDFRPAFTSDRGAFADEFNSCPSRAVVQQQSNGPTSSDSTNWYVSTNRNINAPPNGEHEAADRHTQIMPTCNKKIYSKFGLNVGDRSQRRQFASPRQTTHSA